MIYWGNVVAGVLAPTIFLHFCLVFPERRAMAGAGQGRRAGVVSSRGSASCCPIYVLVAKGMLRVAASPVEVNWFLDRSGCCT